MALVLLAIAPLPNARLSAPEAKAPAVAPPDPRATAFAPDAKAPLTVGVVDPPKANAATPDAVAPSNAVDDPPKAMEDVFDDTVLAPTESARDPLAFA